MQTQTTQTTQTTMLKENERLDDLQFNGLKIIQNVKEYSFTCDSVLLANFVKVKSTEKTLEMCSGSGIIGILAQAKNNIKNLTMIEYQPQMCDMASRSIKLNGLNVNVVNGDIRSIENYFENESFGYIMANPPYKKVDSHFLSQHSNINMSRYEVNLTLDELLKNASKVLKYGGKFALVYDTDRLAEVIESAKKYNLEPKKLQLVYPKNNANSHIFLMECTKNGKTGLRVLPSITL